MMSVEDDIAKKFAAYENRRLCAERARDAIRQLKANGPLTGPVTVMLLSGTYRLSESFVLTGEDSGTPQAPITYTAYPGQQPVLSGGQPISGWTPYRGQVLQCSFP